MSNATDLPNSFDEARDRDWLTPQELSLRTGIAVQTLANWRRAGKGPKFRKLTSRIIAYPVAEVVAWEEAHPLLQAASEWEPGS